jgi:hypothetical protein
MPGLLTDAWLQADSCVHSWLYGSIDSAVLDFTMEPDQTARQLWAAIQDHFTANQAPRAIFLSHSFHTMTQGDLSVEDYGKKMEAADALRDVGMPVDVLTLFLNLLRGVNSRYSTTALYQLKLKELHLENEVKVEATKALVASSSSGCSSSDCRLSSSKPPQLPQQQGNSGSGNGSGGQQRHKKGNGGRRNGGGNGLQFHAPQPAGQWICINPLALQGALGSNGGGGVQWRGGQGILGPPPQANTAFQGSHALLRW